MPERERVERMPEREYEEWSSDLRSSNATIIDSIGSSTVRPKEEKYEQSLYNTWRYRNLMWRGIQSSSIKNNFGGLGGFGGLGNRNRLVESWVSDFNPSIREGFKPSTGLDSTRFKKPQP
jgi:hypothetical protein